MPLDIGVGILIALGASAWFDVPLTPVLLLFAIGAALLPDIDIGTKLWGPWRHRGVTHWPMFYIPIALLVFAILGPVYGTVFSIAIVAHFVHDTVGIGNGVAWFAPVSHKRYHFLPVTSRGIHGDNWVKEFYFRPNPLAFIEYGVLVIALVALGWWFAV